MRGDQLVRQWKILFILATARKGVSIGHIKQKVNCSIRTIYRDLDALQRAGFAIYNNEPDPCIENLWMLSKEDHGAYEVVQNIISSNSNITSNRKEVRPLRK